jgi:hypothetical protein
LLPRWCGSAADSWYDISEELSLRTPQLIPRYFSRGDPVCRRSGRLPAAGRVFRPVLLLFHAFCSSGLLAADKVHATVLFCAAMGFRVCITKP